MILVYLLKNTDFISEKIETILEVFAVENLLIGDQRFFFLEKILSLFNPKNIY